MSAPIYAPDVLIAQQALSLCRAVEVSPHTNAITDGRVNLGTSETRPDVAGLVMNLVFNPLEVLAVEFVRLGCRAQVYGGTLVVSLGAGGERVIACDGRWFRWGGERGHVLGEVGAESASAERAVLVLRQIARWA